MYEGDEVFKTTRDLLLRSGSEGEEVLLSLHSKSASVSSPIILTSDANYMITVLPDLISSPHTNPAVSSVASRILLTLLLQLPHMPPSFVSTDPSMHGRILAQVIRACEICIVHDANNPWSRRGLGILAQVLGHGMEVDDSVSISSYHVVVSDTKCNNTSLLRFTRLSDHFRCSFTPIFHRRTRHSRRH